MKGKAGKGVYALDRNTLRVCDNDPHLDNGRPAAFEAKGGPGNVFLTFERAKP